MAGHTPEKKCTGKIVQDRRAIRASLAEGSGRHPVVPAERRYYRASFLFSNRYFGHAIGPVHQKSRGYGRQARPWRVAARPPAGREHAGKPTTCYHSVKQG